METMNSLDTEVAALSKKRQAIKEAFEKGYRVKSNKVFYKGRQRKLFAHFKKEGNVSAYYSFGIRIADGKRADIYVHQLLAYQKFGDDFLLTNARINHKDKNTLNNSEGNITLEK
jgi:ribosomal protein L23